MASRRLTVLAALVMLASPTFAQWQSWERGPVDLGLWPTGDGSVEALDASQVFTNRQPSGNVYFPGVGALVLDWGSLSSAPENEVFAVDYGYATAAAGPIDLTVRLHPLADGSGQPGVAISTFAFTSLPGSSDGLLTAFTMTTSFTESILPDGPFGWSYEVHDGATGLLLANPEAGSGATDGLELYDQNLVYQGGLDFAGSPIASLYFGLVGSYPGVLGWASEGSILPGTGVWPTLFGAGPLSQDSMNLVDVSGALPSVTGWFVIGSTLLNAPFKGGTLVPTPTLLLPMPMDSSGRLQVPWYVASGVPAGLDVYVQCWFADAGNPAGWASTAGAHGITN